MMSKKNRNQKQKKNFPWPLVLFGGILLIVAAFFFVNRGGGDGGGTPAITVDQQNIDLGYIKLGEYRSLNIKVTNTGDGLLRFKEKPYLEVLEGCCPPELTVGSMTLKPGESTYVRTPDFMMHEGMDGKHDFAVHLNTNDSKNPKFVVHVLSDWGP
jgi:hypothetical protein